MGEFLGFLFIALTIVTLVGHGIWVLLAAVSRAISNMSGPEPAEKRVRCSKCECSNPATLDHCKWCGTLLRSHTAAEQNDLAALRRQLGRLRDRGVVASAVVEDLLARVNEYEDRLLHPAPAPRPVEVMIEPAAKSRGEPSEVSPPLAPITLPIPATPTVVEPPVEPARETEPQPAVAARAEPELPAPAPLAPPALLPPPRKSWMELVAEFFEERNVRLAEVILVLVGGLLIVGGSVAVVISFWEQMESYLKFAVFVGISSAVFGLGLVAYHRWRLEISGRGLLVIATLLVPLNFLAMASLSKEDWTLLTLATELASLAIFVYLVGLASRILVPGHVWHLILAVVGNSAAVLVDCAADG